MVKDTLFSKQLSDVITSPVAISIACEVGELHIITNLFSSQQKIFFYFISLLFCLNVIIAALKITLID